MLRQILVPLDGSPLAESALKYARSIAAPDGNIFLLTVVNLTDFPVSEDAPQRIKSSGGLFNPLEPSRKEAGAAPATVGTHMLDAAEGYLRRMAQALQTATLRVEIGVEADVLPADAIVGTARALRADAIVMATHGRTGLSRLLMGSVAQAVLNEFPCPVFLIPASDGAEKAAAV